MPWIGVIDGAGGAGEVEDEIDFADVEGLADVFFYKIESRIIAEMFEIRAAAGEQVVDDNHTPALAEQGIAEMGSEEAGAAGDQGALWAHAFFDAVAHDCGGDAIGMAGGASYAVIGEAVRRHHFGIIQVAAIDHDGILEFAIEAIEIEVGEFLPLGKDQQGVGAGGGFVGGAGIFEIAVHGFLSAFHGGGIVGGDLAAFLQQSLHQEKSGRFANVVGAALEGEAEHAEVLAAKRPQGAAHFAQKAIALIFVDAHDFIEQAEVITALACNGAKGHHVFREAGTAVADSRIQKSRADAGVGADAMAHLIHVGPDGFADGSDRIDEGNLHSEECVGSVLDQFRALGAGHDDGSGNRSAVGLRNGIAALVIGAAGKGRVNFAQNVGGAFGVAADNNAVGEKKVGDRGAFAEKFRIRSDVEGLRIGAVAQNDSAHPLAGVDRNRALFDDDFIFVDGAGDFASDGLDIGEVGVATIGGRRADGDENDRTGSHRFLQIVGELQTMSAMAAQ